MLYSTSKSELKRRLKLKKKSADIYAVQWRLGDRGSLGEKREKPREESAVQSTQQQGSLAVCMQCSRDYSVIVGEGGRKSWRVLQKLGRGRSQERRVQCSRLSSKEALRSMFAVQSRLLGDRRGMKSWRNHEEVAKKS